MSALDATPVVSSVQVLQTVRRSYLIGRGTLALVVSYLAYAWIAFDDGPDCERKARAGDPAGNRCCCPQGACYQVVLALIA